MEQQPQLNDHNKQEYPPCTQKRHIILFIRQKNRRTEEQKNEIKYVLLSLYLKIKTCL